MFWFEYFRKVCEKGITISETKSNRKCKIERKKREISGANTKKTKKIKLDKSLTPMKILVFKPFYSNKQLHSFLTQLLRNQTFPFVPSHLQGKRSIF